MHTYIVENGNNITDLVSYNLITENVDLLQADVTAIVSVYSPVEQLLVDMHAGICKR